MKTARYYVNRVDIARYGMLGVWGASVKHVQMCTCSVSLTFPTWIPNMQAGVQSLLFSLLSEAPCLPTLPGWGHRAVGGTVHPDNRALMAALHHPYRQKCWCADLAVLDEAVACSMRCKSNAQDACAMRCGRKTRGIGCIRHTCAP